MTTPIQTQCPYCQTCFKVEQEQLNKANATIHCDQCQRNFLVNKHLIVTLGSFDASTTKKTTAKTDTPRSSDSSHPVTKPTEALIHDDMDDTIHDGMIHDDMDDTIHDGLIHDDMDMDEPQKIDVEYDSLDSMEAWLTETNTSISTDKHTSISNKSSHSSTNSVSPELMTDRSSVALSSTAANDIHANIDNKANNAWLEELLKEQSTSDDAPKDDTDLSKLLFDMGVPLKETDTLLTDRANKEPSHTKSTPVFTKHSIASLLWTLGCLVLALLLFAQYIIFNLDTLVKNPVHAERLQTVCSVAACSLPSADLTAFTVTNTAHKSSQIQTAAWFSDVSATLNNQSMQTQLYPDIKVSIYGENTLIGEFIAAPDDYLLSKQRQLAAEGQRQLLFTIPIANSEIQEVTLSALY